VKSNGRNQNMEVPRMVAIETTNRCNATCSFCPNSKLARQRTTMSDELFESIIADCQTFQPDTIEPFLNGEPFMDPKIIERMEFIRAKLPNTKLKLYTNANLLTPQKTDRLKGLGIDQIFVSLNSVNAETYKKVMGLNLQKTMDNLKYLTSPDVRSKVCNNITFRMTRTPYTTLFEQDQFLEYCKQLKVKPFIVGLFNYKGDIQSPLPIPGYPCEHIDRLDILADGRVTLCCMDHEGQYSWGDVKEDSLLEVFNSEIALKYRNMHRTGKRLSIPPCGTCNLFWPSFKHMPLPRKASVAIEAGWYFLSHHPNGRIRQSQGGDNFNNNEI